MSDNKTIPNESIESPILDQLCERMTVALQWVYPEGRTAWELSATTGGLPGTIRTMAKRPFAQRHSRFYITRTGGRDVIYLTRDWEPQGETGGTAGVRKDPAKPWSEYSFYEKDPRVKGHNALAEEVFALLQEAYPRSLSVKDLAEGTGRTANGIRSFLKREKVPSQDFLEVRRYGKNRKIRATLNPDWAPDPDPLEPF